jgi:hypothetical protein
LKFCAFEFEILLLHIQKLAHPTSIILKKNPVAGERKTRFRRRKTQREKGKPKERKKK